MDHIQNLQNLCRVCGDKVILKHGYVTAKSTLDYKETIAIHYGVNVVDEDEHVFPKLICTKCNQKLRKLMKSNKSQLFQIADFKQHDGENCKVCFDRSVESKSKQTLNWFSRISTKIFLREIYHVT